MFLRELRDSVGSIKGIGKVSQKALEGFGIQTVADLLVHFPRGYEDRQARKSLGEIKAEGQANTVVTIISHSFFGPPGKSTLKILVSDETGTASLVCFGRNFLSRSLVPGRKYFLFGHFAYRFNELQSSSFETEPFTSQPSNFGIILPIYPLTGALTQNFFRKTIRSAVDDHLNAVDSEMPEILRNRRKLLSKRDAIRQIHYPPSQKAITKARKTLCFEELFFLQLIVKRRTLKARANSRELRTLSDSYAQKLINRLDFRLTVDQEKVFGEIRGDLQSAVPMTRLLQGDVGCGKTLVALLSALLIVEDGGQVAIMAPTELLARQHAESAAELLEPLGIRAALLSSNVKAEARRHLLQALKNGEIDILLGTHALFSKDVRYKNLGLAIVDEQHRFGVLQRISLVEKGEGRSGPDLLLMTATPIPRSLALTVFGDLDVSTIRTMPLGRKPVATHLTRLGNEEKVYSWVTREIENGRQAYFVYPLIQQSSALDLKDAESAYADLAGHVFPGRKLALIHSKLPEETKRHTMTEFKAGRIDILVATSVVEVGVNVANATCMVVEHADRFGLSALHQLRGRVGRAEYQSHAFLVYHQDAGEDAKARLMAMKEHNDGFAISEMDLNIRGPGELTGIHQSGRFRLLIADIVRDLDLLKLARHDVDEILTRDPGLLEPQNAIVRQVLERAAPFTDDLVSGG
ncbi:MAG: ATP-dependent DNA helicase RecG [Spirochaetales bacterium]|jgi:ATP-dependent DNA helicase RecG|nr:ATP-dependent DNA helicase RecG [Spirochaetales bacterium]